MRKLKLTTQRRIAYNQLIKSKSAHLLVMSEKRMEEGIMRKMLKKLSMLLLSVMMLMMTAGQLSVTAAPAEEMTVVYVQIPEDWEGPCIWAWNEDGSNAFDAWPGGTMKADDGNEGWYYAWIPNWATHVIINGNEGNVQTQEQILEGRNVWITISSPEEVSISYDQQTEGEIPEYVETFPVHVKVPGSWSEPYMWAWSAPDGTNVSANWPGEPLTMGENDWYTMELPTWVNSIIVNANGGDVQTEEISIDAAELWVTVLEDGSADFTYNDPDKEEVADITVRIMAPSDWTGLNLWAWSAPDGTNAFANWPGEALQEDENGWLKMQVPGWVNSLIVNGNEGNVQTTDISVDPGKDVWLVVKGPEETEVYYEEPQVDAADTSEEADAEETTATEEEAPEEEGSSMTVVWIIVAVVVVAVVAAGIVIAVKKKK